MRNAVLVLGMHRSGTSAMSGALVQLGAAAPKEIMGADAGNERGYFESVPFMFFHDELLAFAGSHWHDWRRFDPQRLAAIPERSREEAKRLLDQEFGDTPLFVLKDPRVCRFVPFWRSVLAEANIAPHAVIPFRAPMEVAASLRARNGFPLEKGLLLWLRHILDTERDTRGLPRSFAHMEELLSDWRACLTRVGQEIGIAWPDFDGAAERVGSFLTRDLKHHNDETLDHSAAPAWIGRTYEALMILTRNAHSRLASAALDEVAGSFEQACALIGPTLDDLEVQNARLRADLTAREVEEGAPAGTAPDPAPPPDARESRAEPAAAALDELQSLRAKAAEVRATLERLRDSLPSSSVTSV